MDDAWRTNLLTNDASIAELLRATKRIAVLGAKPDSHPDRPAYYVPRYMGKNGYTLYPVPVYYPDVTEILGRPVYRSLAEIPDAIDLVDVFRKPVDIPAHVSDILAKRPIGVWFQLGIRHDGVAEQLARAGIKVVQDRCLMVEHERLIGGY
jgi:hypothetical protein